MKTDLKQAIKDVKMADLGSSEMFKAQTEAELKQVLPILESIVGKGASEFELLHELSGYDYDLFLKAVKILNKEY